MSQLAAEGDFLPGWTGAVATSVGAFLQGQDLYLKWHKLCAITEAANPGKEPDLKDAVVILGLERAEPSQAKPLWSGTAPGAERDRPGVTG